MTENKERKEWVMNKNNTESNRKDYKYIKVLDFNMEFTNWIVLFFLKLFPKIAILLILFFAYCLI